MATTPRMTNSGPWLLFEGACGVCSLLARKALAMDSAAAYRILPYQEVSEADLLKLGCSRQACSRRLHLVSSSGRIHRGAFAVNRFLWGYFPWTVVVGLIYAMPLLLLFEVLGYEWIARSRDRLSRWLTLKGCILS